MAVTVEWAMTMTKWTESMDYRPRNSSLVLSYYKN